MTWEARHVLVGLRGGALNTLRGGAGRPRLPPVACPVAGCRHDGRNRRSARRAICLHGAAPRRKRPVPLVPPPGHPDARLGNRRRARRTGPDLPFTMTEN